MAFFDDFSGVKPNNYDWVSLDDPLGADNDILFTALDVVDGGDGTHTVNVSTKGLGSNSQAVSPGEAIRADFVTGVNLDSSEFDDFSLISFTGYYADAPSRVGFIISQTGGPATNTVEAKITVYDEATPGTFTGTADLTDDVSEQITLVEIFDGVDLDNPIETVEFTGVGTFGSVTFNADGSVTVTGLLVDYRVFVSTEDGFDRMLVENVSTGSGNNDFDIGGFIIDAGTSGDPIDMSFDLTVTDEDGDSILVLDAINVTLLPEIAGDGDANVLIGNGDDEFFIGGGGADKFVFSAVDDEGTDRLVDFSTSELDVLSFTDVTDGGDPGIDIGIEDVVSSFTDGVGAGAVDTVELFSGTTLLITDVSGTLTDFASLEAASEFNVV
jgi:hypothetical protein